ncbi:hypothetical protein O6H91_Y312300 [Diphasiastrum complanatum]|nr:hypothetical protein O6H91_Y312300 [Diphasiastrum complanatum]
MLFFIKLRKVQENDKLESLVIEAEYARSDEEDKTNEHHVYDDENKVQKTRKSKQAHKLSMKMQNIVEVGRHVYKGSKKLVRITKKMKGLSELERPSSKAKIVHDVHNVEDLETIAIKYFNIHTVDELYKKLKDLYSSLKISKKNSWK